MVDPGTAIAVGSAIVGAGQKIFGRKRRPDNRRAIAELRAARPTGYLTGEDYRAGELTKGRLTEGAQSQGRLASTEVSRRARARGLGGSPSEERSQARVSQEVALGTQRAGESAEELLYNTQRGREAFQQQSALAIFGAETNTAAREGARMDAQDAAFWNSLNEFLPTIFGYLEPTETTVAGGGGGVGPGTGVRGFNPSAGRRPPLRF